MNNLGIVFLSVIPLKESPSHKSETISQVLFGETCIILEDKDEWTKVQLVHDDYTGWILTSQWISIDIKNTKNLKLNRLNFGTAIFNNQKIFIPLGGYIWQNDIDDEFLSQYKFSEDINCLNEDTLYYPDDFIKTAESFLEAPYLWGGKTILGIDCSGLTQSVYKANGIQLPRDAYQQAELGRSIPFDKLKTADLAFFKNEKGRITHVGIIHSIVNGQVNIIHGSGRVKIDRLDEKGIIDLDQIDSITYSHHLAFIKRIIE